MTNPITPEELDRMRRTLNSGFTLTEATSRRLIAEVERLQDVVALQFEQHLDLLWHEYALAEDDALTDGAKKIKAALLAFVDKCAGQAARVER